MQPLSSTSQRRSVAPKFAAELRKAIRTRGGSTLRVAEATKVPRSNLGYYLQGRNLPTIEVAQRLADTLQAPRLLELVLEARTIQCGRPGCPRSFTYEGGKPKIYCSEDCAKLAAKLRVGDDPYDTGGRRLYDLVSAELVDARESRRAVRRQALEVGLVTYAESDSKRRARFSTFQRRIDAQAEAIDSMCRSCEPEGLCQTAECPLRAFSPLPLRGSYTEARPNEELRKPEGSWSPTFRPKTMAAIQAAADKRWNRPGERERMAELGRARHAAMTDEERAARGAAISRGRRVA